MLTKEQQIFWVAYQLAGVLGADEKYLDLLIDAFEDNFPDFDPSDPDFGYVPIPLPTITDEDLSQLVLSCKDLEGNIRLTFTDQKGNIRPTHVCKLLFNLFKGA